MRIGTAPVNWNSADVDIRPWVEYRQMLDEMVAGGYDATEWGPGFPDDAEAVSGGRPSGTGCRLALLHSGCAGS